MFKPAPAIPKNSRAVSSVHLKLENVTKKFRNGNLVLDRINLEIPKAAFVSIIGPSGCGKSTLLKLIAGLSPVSSGSVVVGGMTPANAREIMAFIFQDATLLPWRNVQQNVELGLELNGVGPVRRKEKADEMLALVGLTNVSRQYPRQLSGGMKMRVSIARALTTRPEILLMDEPFAALDEMNRDRLNEELLRLRSLDQWTGLFVTHSVSEAVFLSDRVIVLSPHPGRIAYDLSVRFTQPRSADLRNTIEYEEQVAEVSKLLRTVFR